MDAASAAPATRRCATSRAEVGRAGGARTVRPARSGTPAARCSEAAGRSRGRRASPPGRRLPSCLLPFGARGFRGRSYANINLNHSCLQQKPSRPRHDDRQGMARAGSPPPPARPRNEVRGAGRRAGAPSAEGRAESPAPPHIGHVRSGRMPVRPHRASWGASCLALRCPVRSHHPPAPPGVQDGREALALTGAPRAESIRSGLADAGCGRLPRITRDRSVGAAGGPACAS